MSEKEWKEPYDGPELTDKEIEMQKRYAEKIVESIYSREDDPRNRSILFFRAMNPSLSVVEEMSRQGYRLIKENEEEK